MNECYGMLVFGAKSLEWQWDRVGENCLASKLCIESCVKFL